MDAILTTLWNEDKSQNLNIWFLGWTQERVEKYIQQKFTGHSIWVQFKLISGVTFTQTA